jgi:hypothetical protein
MLPRPAALIALALLSGWGVKARAQQVLLDTADSGPAPPPSPFTAPPQNALIEPAPTPPVTAAAGDRPFRPPAGWFASADLFLASPHSTIMGFPFGGGLETVPDLDTTLSPQATLGYRFERGNAFLVSYRYLGGSGQNDHLLSDNTFVHGSAGFNSNWVDLDYCGCLHGPWLWFTFQWQTGLRIAVVDYENGGNYTDRVEDVHTSFFGAGPHFGIDLNWYLGPTGLGIFGRGDVGLEFGRGTQHTATHVLPTANYTVWGPSGQTDFFAYDDSGKRTVLNVIAECGLSWTPPTQRWLRFESGLQSFLFSTGERWFTNIGPFLRCEVGF